MVLGSGVTGSSVDEALARFVLLHKVNSWISNVAWVFLQVANPCPFCCEHKQDVVTILGVCTALMLYFIWFFFQMVTLHGAYV
jgi:hypothetical protein